MKTMMNETPNEISTTNSRGNNKMKKFTKLFKNQKGLTLIELLAVIVILAIVAAIATPAIGNVIDNSRDKAILADAATILSGAKLAVTAGDCSPTATPKCDDTVLKDKYVSGIKAGVKTTGVTYEVTKSGEVYSVKLSKFEDIKNTTKYPIPTGNTITETALNNLLN